MITAGLDTLSKAMYRGESDDTLFSMRSFFVNKIPLLLCYYYASMGSVVPLPMLETYMVAAFNQRGFNAFSSFHGSDVASGNTLLSNVRQQFVYACALQKLIPESSIGSILGERSASSKPVGPRLAKEVLVARCQANPEKAQELLARLESMDGNVGVVAGALVEVLTCSNPNPVITRLMFSLPDHAHSVQCKRDYVSQELVWGSLAKAKIA